LQNDGGGIEMKICFRCKQPIDVNDHYYTFIEVNKKKVIKTDYAHKICWDKFLSTLDSAQSSLSKSNYLLDAMGSQMAKMGLLPPKEEVIVL